MHSKSPIVFFVNTLAGGGTERVVLQLANYYAEQGQTVNLVLAKKTGQFLKQLDKRVVVFELNTFLNRKRLIKKAFNRSGLLVFFQILSLNRLVKKHKISSLLCFGEWPNLIGPLIKLLPSKKHIKIIISERSSRSFISDPAEYNLRPYLRNLALVAFKKTNIVVACAEYLKDALTKINPESGELIKVIKNPLDLPKIENSVKENVQHPFFLKQAAHKTLIAAGRLHKSKDYPTMLRAFALVKRATNAKLIILGDGPLKEELQSLCKELNISEDVSIVGFVDNPYKYLAKADLFIHSAIYEGFPNVIAEALACGLDVVSTDCDGAEEVLQGGKYGIIVPKQNPKELADAIIKALQEKRSKEFQRTGVDAYSIRAIAESYLNIIQLPH